MTLATREWTTSSSDPATGVQKGPETYVSGLWVDMGSGKVERQGGGNGSPQGSGNWFTDHSLEIKETAKNAIAGWAGFKKFQAAKLLAIAPDPTCLTKAAAVYFALDGGARMGGAAVRTVGVWTDWENNTDLARAPTNLLGVVGYVVNGVSGGSFYMGSRTQVLFEMQGDLINSRRAITNGINTFSDAWQVVVPSYGAYNKAMQIR